MKNEYLLRVHYCIGTKRKSSIIKKIKLTIQEGINDFQLKEMIRKELDIDRKITIIAKKKVKKGKYFLYFELKTLPEYNGLFYCL